MKQDGQVNSDILNLWSRNVVCATFSEVAWKGCIYQFQTTMWYFLRNNNFKVLGERKDESLDAKMTGVFLHYGILLTLYRNLWTALFTTVTPKIFHPV